jgi:hypothetical protein
MSPRYFQIPAQFADSDAEHEDGSSVGADFQSGSEYAKRLSHSATPFRPRLGVQGQWTPPESNRPPCGRPGALGSATGARPLPMNPPPRSQRLALASLCRRQARGAITEAKRASHRIKRFVRAFWGVWVWRHRFPRYGLKYFSTVERN